MEDVPRDTSDLVLTLTRGLAITGRVVDDAGRPIRRCTLEASLQGGEWYDTRDVEALFLGEPGHFRINGLREGRWLLEAEAKGYVETSFLVSVPTPDEQVVTLQRAAKISGTVVDPDGSPASGAFVRAFPANEHRWWKEDNAKRVNEDGTFDAHAPIGRVYVYAEAPGFARSETMELQLAAGDRHEGVQLDLRTAGRITGQLVSTDGESVAGRKVSLESRTITRDPVSDERATDADGQFVFEVVTPGSYMLEASPTTDRAEGFRTLDGEWDWAAWNAATKSTWVRVHDSETVHVVLGAECPSSIRISGRVHVAGEPVRQVGVWVAAADDPESVAHFASTGGRRSLRGLRTRTRRVLILAEPRKLVLVVRRRSPRRSRARGRVRSPQPARSLGESWTPRANRSIESL